jgi:pimeloyl-ACP methyl ester carboxylesterase
MNFSRLPMVAGMALLLSTAASSADSGRATRAGVPEGVGARAAGSPVSQAPPQVRYRTVAVDKLGIFYREAGPKDAPAILLLHGFPTSSHMFRNLIPRLAERYRVVAPDYPGFGQSSMPPRDKFVYSFDNLAKVIDDFTVKVGLSEYTLYVQDYGAPIGFRIASAHPERIRGLVIQNGNAYDEGLREFWKPIKAYWADPSAKNRQTLAESLTLETLKWQYTHGVRDATRISPDNWVHDAERLNRPGNREIQLDLFLSYGSNPPLYPRWQEYFRKHQPPALIVWGKNDQIFPAEGAHPYRRDLKNVELHLLDTGHFALEEHGPLIAERILAFMKRTSAERAARLKTGRAGG